MVEVVVDCLVSLSVFHFICLPILISCKHTTFSHPPLTPHPSSLSHLIASPLQCGTIDDEGPNEGLTERSLQDAQRLYLMNDVVQPESVDPLVMQDDVRFSNLVVDIVQGMDTLYHVMYISTG